MKKIGASLLSVIVMLLIGCIGSDTYRGNWKGMTSDGEKVEIAFDEHKMTISDSTGQSETYGYNQHSVNIKNSVETYGIKLDDGRGYQINFPIANDESVGLIKDENNNVLYSICKTKYILPEEIFKLN